MNANTMSFWGAFLALLLLLLIAGQQHLANAMRVFECAAELHNRLPRRVQPSHYNLYIEIDPDSGKFKGGVKIDLNILQTNPNPNFNFNFNSNSDSDSSLNSTLNSNSTLNPNPSSSSNSNSNSNSYSDPTETLWLNSLKPQAHAIATNPKLIILNAEKLELGDVVRFHQMGERQKVKSICHDAINKIVVVELSKDPVPGEPARLTFSFVGSVQKEAKGLFLSKDTLSPYVYTNFEPNYARLMFPCFDHPQFKATFGVTIKHPLGRIALSNKEVQKEDESGNYKITQFKTTPMMSTYLLSLAVGPFKKIQRRYENGLELTVYAPISTSFLVTDMFIEATAAHRKVSRFFKGLKTQLEKIDILAVEEEDTSMQNWGLIIMSNKLLSVDPSRSTPGHWILASTTMMSKLIHQSLASLVTIHESDSRWLVEGLVANLAVEIHPYSAHLQTIGPRPQIDMELYTLMETTFSAMNDEGQIACFSECDLKTPINSFTYRKSAALVRMFVRFFGKDFLKEAIRDMIRMARSTNVLLPMEVNTFWNTIFSKTVLNFDMATVVRLWAERIEYPVVLTDLIDQRILRLSLVNPEQDWLVPVRFELHGGPQEEPVYSGECILSESIDFPLPSWFDINDPSQWLMVNPEYEGYYGVLYQSEFLFGRLLAAASARLMSTADIIQLLASSYMHARRMQYADEFLKVLNALSMSAEVDTGLALAMTKILNNMYNNGWPLARGDICTHLVVTYHNLKGGVYGEITMDMLEQWTRGKVVDYLANKLSNRQVLVEMRDITRQPISVAFLQEAIDNRIKASRMYK